MQARFWSKDISAFAADFEVMKEHQGHGGSVLEGSWLILDGIVGIVERKSGWPAYNLSNTSSFM